MGRTIGEWETYFEQLSSDFLTEIINALETLQKAEMFFEEFEWTHLFTLAAIAKEVKRQRIKVWSRELEASN
ncbi:MAG: hypothetical protein KAW52_09005 [candidate division Zixibacteria bacterium]|nr:hypothetical protein [candidate division Zixibacteria bacterium]